MKKLYTLILAFLLFIVWFGNANAENYIQIGSGTVSTSLPFYSSWKYGWGSLIYNQSDLGGAKSITKIAFYSLNAKTMNNQKVYMKLTTDAVFASGAYENPTVNGYTLVYNGSITSVANAWMELTLIAPFAYDGTKNLAIHVENSQGVEYNTINFSSTASTINNTKDFGCDACTAVPTGNGWLNPNPYSLPNIKIFYVSTDPSTPSNEIPLSNAIKVSALPLTLNVDLGANTTSFDLYFGKNQTLVTNLDASVKVVTDAAVSAPGTFSYNIPSILDSKTKYYWKVVAKNSTSSTPGPLWNFRVQEVIAIFPYKQDFESVRIPNPFLHDTLSNIIDTNYPDSTGWSFTPLSWSLSNQYKGHTGIYGARCSNAYVGEFYLKSPRINLTENQRLSFWYKYYAPAGFTGTLSPVVCQITTNGGTSWSPLATISPSSPMTNWDFTTIDLTTYSGNNVYLRWVVQSATTSTGVFFLDDIEIKEIPNGAIINLDNSSHAYQDICVNGKMPFDVIIRNTGTANLVITGSNKVGPYTCDFTGTILPSKSDTATMYFAPTAAGDFNGSVEFIAAGITEGNKVTLTGKGLQPISTFFESFDAINQIPATWYTINSPAHQFSKVSIISGTYDANSQPNCIKMLCFPDYNYPISLITPGVTGFGINKLTFYAKKYDASYDIDLIIGVMDNPYNVNDFVEVDRVRLTATYAKYEAVIPAENTKPYIVFRYGGYAAGETSLKSIRIDDISWDAQAVVVPNPAIIASPLNNATNVDILKQVELKWANGGGNPEGFKVYLGTTTAANDLVNGTQTTATNTFYKYTGSLEYSKTYYWKVVPFNQTGDANNCSVWSFTTMADPTITSFPFVENFDGITNIPGFTYPLGWSIENHNNDGMCWDIIANNGNYINSFSSPNAMHVAFNYNPKDDYLYSPPLQLQQGKLYQLTYKLRTMKDMVTGLIYTEKIKVFLGSTNNSSTMTKLVSNDFVNQDAWKDVSGTFTVDQSGKYFLGFYAYSDPEQYLLIIDNVKVVEISEGAPTVDFIASKTTAEAGEVVTLTNTSICNPAASSFEWTITPSDFTFMDGTNQNSENPKVKFRFAGKYSVSLKVTNSKGFNTKQAVDYITVTSLGLLAPQNLTAVAGTGLVTLNWKVPSKTKINEGFEGVVDGWSMKKSVNPNGSDLVDAVIGTDNTWGVVDKVASADFAKYVHTGNKAIFINYTAGEGAAPDYSWLITPEVSIVSGDQLKYWIMYLNGPAGDGNSYYTLFHIMVNDGTGWVSIFDYNAQSPVNAMETEVSHNLSTYAGKTVRFAFVHQYNDGYQLSLDDIRVVEGGKNASKSSGNVSFKQTKQLIKTSPLSIAFASKGSTLSGYNIYRNHQFVTKITDPLAITYVDNGLSIGHYEYQLSAVYTTPDGESDPAFAAVDLATSVEPTKLESGMINVYPNPSNGRFVVKVNSDNFDDVVINIFTIIGQKIYSTTMTSETLSINLQNLEKGVYILSAKSKNKTISTKIVIR